MTRAPVQLSASLVEKVWGVERLEPWLRSPGGRIGEAWYSLPQGPPLPILVKLLFTSDRLSVQVHPGETYARAHEGSGGKAEMWYVLAAEPGATLALGFLEPVTRQRARRAAETGEIESLLRWWPVSAGQVYYVPPGTVHALGAGLTICEIQQNNPVTYRMYDYGRPRDLQLDRAVEALRLQPHPGPAPPAGQPLVSCPHFVVERLEAASLHYQPDPERFHLLIAIEGAGEIGGASFAPGQVWYISPGAEPFQLSAAAGRAVFLRAYVPA
ncbi:MAG TPA: class I mannose-6-phosphate isomerase [Bryobacteraceae bacterium]|nr:class I mannose-6-phosphate isomerase [Bryobacteraceae bacterium]